MHLKHPVCDFLVPPNPPPPPSLSSCHYRNGTVVTYIGVYFFFFFKCLRHKDKSEKGTGCQHKRVPKKSIFGKVTIFFLSPPKNIYLMAPPLLRITSPPKKEDKPGIGGKKEGKTIFFIYCCEIIIPRSMQFGNYYLYNFSNNIVKHSKISN